MVGVQISAIETLTKRGKEGSFDSSQTQQVVGSIVGDSIDPSTDVKVLDQLEKYVNDASLDLKKQQLEFQDGKTDEPPFSKAEGVELAETILMLEIQKNALKQSEYEDQIAKYELGLVTEKPDEIKQNVGEGEAINSVLDILGAMLITESELEEVNDKTDGKQMVITMGDIIVSVQARKSSSIQRILQDK